MKTVCLLLLGALLAACGSSPLATWQRDVARFVKDEGGGDVSSVRLATPAGNRFDTVAVGKKGSSRTAGAHTNVRGVIVGVAGTPGRRWVVFLTGVEKVRGVDHTDAADRTQVESIRAVALAFDGGEPVWREGETDAKALGAYLESRGVAPDAVSTRFPGPADRFELSSTPDEATVRHVASGATWSVRLAE